MVVLLGPVRAVHEPLVAQVPFAAAEEDIWTLLLLHALIAAKIFGRKETISIRTSHKAFQN